MHISPLAQRLLQLVFALSSGSPTLTRPRLERRLATTRSDLNGALDELSRRGLLDARRLRLTLSGLAIAVACATSVRAGGRRASRKPAKMSRLHVPIALFAEREMPRAVA
jgi:hypothetical protein